MLRSGVINHGWKTPHSLRWLFQIINHLCVYIIYIYMCVCEPFIFICIYKIRCFHKPFDLWRVISQPRRGHGVEIHKEGWETLGKASPATGTGPVPKELRQPETVVQKRGGCSNLQRFLWQVLWKNLINPKIFWGYRMLQDLFLEIFPNWSQDSTK